MDGVRGFLRVLKKLFRGKGIGIRRRGRRALSNSTGWHGGSRKAGGSKLTGSKSSAGKETLGALPEGLDDTLDYIHDNIGDDIVLELQGLEGIHDDDIVLEILQDQEGRWGITENKKEDRCRPHLTELYGDERKAVELECRQGLKNQGALKIKRVFEVQNIPKTFYEFEEHRQLVMAKARNAPPYSQDNEVNFSWSEKENKRGAWTLSEQAYVRANGNELQRYYGTTVACSLSSSSSGDSTSTIEVCDLDQCRLCSELKQGLGQAVTTSTAVMAKLNNKHVMLSQGQDQKAAAVVVCRVIAGKIIKSRSCSQWRVSPTLDQLDTVALNDDDLYVQNTKAILPCFVVIY